MEVFRDIANVRKDKESVLTVGTFDGIHLGHKFILDELKSRAKSRGFKSTIVTFRPHPKLVLQPPDRPSLQILTTTDEKIDLLQDAGIDRVVVIEFTKKFSKISAPDFVKNILFEQVGFAEFVIGYDHAFGKNREGSIKTLRSMAAELYFNLNELPAYENDSQKVSSTAIRNLLSDCKIKEANKLLGRNYVISGEVVKGEGRGKSLRFPTANLNPTSKDKLIPGNGVFAVYAYLDHKKYQGMMNIGVRPTFNSHDKRTIEVHIFDFDRDIYGENLKIEIVDKIRNEMRFSGPQELADRLNQDRQLSKNIL